MRKGSMTREELDAYNQGLEDAWERFNREYGHLVDRDNPKKPKNTESVNDEMRGNCSVCGRNVHIWTYERIAGVEWFFCPTCGHRIDWS